MACPGTRGQLKAHLKRRAQALFPRVELALKTADALLVLEAGSMTNNGAERVEKSLLLESSIEKAYVVWAMSTLLNQPVPKNIREQMIRRMETAPEDVVVLVHDVLLQIEKENLWQKIQGDASEDAKSGKLDRVGEIIQNYRDARRSA
jgi:hypothetical protein